MSGIAECTTCGLVFAYDSAFDEHRVGDYHQKEPSEYRDRVDRGLEPPPSEAEWKPSRGRRCLGADELEALGWKKDQHDRWRMPEKPKGEPVLARIEL